MSKQEYLSKQVFQRYLLLERTLKSKNCSYKMILKIFEKEGIDITKRTLQNDIAFLKNNNIEILESGTKEKFFRYAVNEKGLFKNQTDEFLKLEYNLVLHFLGNFVNFLNVDIIKEFLVFLKQEFKVDYKEQSILSFQDLYSQGVEYILDLFEAIYNNSTLVITYKSFTNDAHVYYKDIHPYQLKLFNNRWYLVCYDNGDTKSIVNLALDRIKNIEKTGNTFVRTIKVLNKYNDVIGVTVLENSKKEKIKLRFKASYFPYVETKKIHHTQKKIQPNIITIDIRPNEEFYSRILSFGNNVEVIEPDYIREEVVKRIVGSLSLYK